MAVGDVFSVLLGTAATNRQPAAGVAERLTSLHKDGATDVPALYDGTTTKQIMMRQSHQIN